MHSLFGLKGLSPSLVGEVHTVSHFADLKATSNSLFDQDIYMPVVRIQSPWFNLVTATRIRRHPLHRHRASSLVVDVPHLDAAHHFCLRSP